MHQSVHRLTKTIQNPYAPYTDKRSNNGWLDKDELPEGMLFMIEKHSPDKMAADGYTWRTVEVSRAVQRGDQPMEAGIGIVLWREITAPNGDVSIVYDGDLNAKHAESPKDKKRAVALTALAVLMQHTLSTDELVEYRTAFLSRDERLSGDPGDVLHHLFLTGAVSLDMIKAARKALHEKAEEEWRLEKAAKAGK